MYITESDLTSKIVEDLKDSAPTDVNVEAEVQFSNQFLPNIYPGMKSLNRMRSDILISKYLLSFPSELDQIEDIERWFPNKKVPVPVAVLEIKTGDQRLPWDTLSQLNSHPLNPPLQFIIESPFFSRKLGSRLDTEFILSLGEGTEEEIHEEITVPILNEVGEINESELTSLVDSEEIVKSFDSKVFHFNEVLRAYRADKTEILIILLSIYFESWCRSRLEEHFQTTAENDQAASVSDKMPFKSALDTCRGLGLLPENDYRLMNNTRKSRNKYAHGIERFHGSERTVLEEDGDVEDAIRLYEKSIGVDDSMLD